MRRVFMAFNSVQMTSTAATLACAMGIEPPKLAGEPIGQVLSLVKKYAKSGKCQRILIYNPDAIAQWLYQKYTAEFAPVMERTRMTIPMLASFPPVTPVCFATMFSGAIPKVHGIEVYEKKLVKIDTLFDALPRQGKKTTLIARTDSSMGTIFTGRPIDYHNYDNDEEITQQGLKAISEDQHDVVVVYNMDYDDSIHDTEPESKRSYEAMCRHIRDFARLVDCACKAWQQYDTLFLFAPDHGIHKTILGDGNHFCDSPEDMNILHFYGFKAAGESR